MVDETDIAVTVIGGYLGAGKTTLVNHILRTADQRIAVLVNDFGDINIDQDLIASQDGDTISLANGCICCSLVDGFSAALDKVQAADPQPERLVIEASGVADPATVSAYGHGPGLMLDATIVVVDAETIRAKSQDVYVGDTVLGQLRSGDIVVLNKVDLVGQDEVQRTSTWLRERCADAVIIGATNGIVDPALLFGVIDTPVVTRGDLAGRDAGGEHATHAHASSVFEAWSWSSENSLERARVEALMESLPDQVVRAKGLVTLDDDPEQVMALQRVGRRWTLRPFGPRTADHRNRLVVIGFHGAIADDWLNQQLT